MKTTTGSVFLGFAEKVERILEKFGAEENPSAVSTFKLNTKYGTLFITPRTDERSEVFTIFMRFDTLNWKRQELIKAAKKHFSTTNLNKFTGKWNVHELDGEAALTHLESKLEFATK
jgi:hypothetical protein